MNGSDARKAHDKETEIMPSYPRSSSAGTSTLVLAIALWAWPACGSEPDHPVESHAPTALTAGGEPDPHRDSCSPHGDGRIPEPLWSALGSLCTQAKRKWSKCYSTGTEIDARVRADSQACQNQGGVYICGGQTLAYKPCACCRACKNPTVPSCNGQLITLEPHNLKRVRVKWIDDLADPAATMSRAVIGFGKGLTSDKLNGYEDIIATCRPPRSEFRSAPSPIKVKPGQKMTIDIAYRCEDDPSEFTPAVITEYVRPLRSAFQAMVSSVTSTSARVSWDGGGHESGAVLVSYGRADSDEAFDISVPGWQTEVELTGLSPGIEYEVQVAKDLDGPAPSFSSLPTFQTPTDDCQGAWWCGFGGELLLAPR